MQSEKDKIMELLTVTEVKEGGEVTFTDRSIEILQELGQQYKETPLFKKSRQDKPNILYYFLVYGLRCKAYRLFLCGVYRKTHFRLPFYLFAYCSSDKVLFAINRFP